MHRQIMAMVEESTQEVNERTFDERIAEGEKAIEACRQVGAKGFRATLRDAKGQGVQSAEFPLDEERTPAQRERWAVKEEGEQRRQVRLPDGPRFAIPGLKAALPALLARADSERLNLLVEALGAYIFVFECSGSPFVPQSSFARMLPHSFLVAEISHDEKEVLVCLSIGEHLEAGRMRVVRPVDTDEANKTAHQISAHLEVNVSRQFFLPGSLRFIEGDSFEVVARPSRIVQVDRQKLIASGALPFDLTIDAPAMRAARGERTQYALAHDLPTPKI